jgi:N-acyl-D-aspartate/D-glutamate deacylase
MPVRYAATAILGTLIIISALAQQLRETHSVLVRDTTLIDGTGRPPMSHMSVLLSKGRISTVGPATVVELHEHAEIVDGRGSM